MSWVRTPLAAPININLALLTEPSFPRTAHCSISGEKVPVDVLRPDPPDALDLASGKSRIFAGTSGWAYPTWKPGFYPPKTPAAQFLRYYADHLTAVEVNYTFRALPTSGMLQTW